MDHIVKLQTISESPPARDIIERMNEKLLDVATNYKYNIINNKFLVDRLREILFDLSCIIIRYSDFAWNIKCYIIRILSDDYIPDYMKTIFNSIDQGRIETCIEDFRIISHITIAPCDMSKELEEMRIIIDSVQNSYDKLLQISNEVHGVIERVLSS